VGRASPEVDQLISYAESLHKKQLPILYDVGHLCDALGVSREYLLAAAFAPDKYYRDFYILKHNGKRRLISEPLPLLKFVQRWIHDEILLKQPISRFAKAYRPGVGIKSAARFHQAQELVLRVDLKDFFPSVEKRHVYGVFRKMGYCKEVASLLARLCYRKGLPQGAPSSPVLSNLVCRKLDSRVSGYCVAKSIRYTRYADDLIFSGDRGFEASLMCMLSRVIRESGFKINHAKTRCFYPHQQQRVLGLVVNDKVSVPRRLRRQIRQCSHYIEKHGFLNHASRQGITKRNYYYHLMGLANYVLSCHPTDRDSLKFELLKEYGAH